MELLYASAADHLAVGDVEMAVAIWERLTDCDEDDRLEAVVMLAFCYPVLEEWDCFDDAMFDVPMKSPEYSLLTLWCGFCRCGGIDRDALRTLRTRHKAWYDEFVAAEHPASEEFVAEIAASTPRRRPRRASCGLRRSRSGDCAQNLSRRCARHRGQDLSDG